MATRSVIKRDPDRSVLDNKETFLQKSRNEKGGSSQKKAFYTVYYRHRNLSLADLLDASAYADQDHINKTIRSLRFCSQNSIIGFEKGKEVAILSTSKTCKNAHCVICAKNRSNKLAMRLEAALRDSDNAKVFNGKYFYFLTLTVKHNEEVRTGNYLKEFSAYVNKLMRSDMWQDIFGGNKKKKDWGTIVCKECTLGDNGYHIHCHIIVCASPLREKAKVVQSRIRNKWFAITKDSDVIRFDLLNDLNNSSPYTNSEVKNGEVLRVVKELFKYGTKTGSLSRIKGAKVDRLCEWIIESKGKNFVNASGIFRGLGITGLRSKYDREVKVRKIEQIQEGYFCHTSKIVFNYPTAKEYSTQLRKRILERIYVKRLPDQTIDCTSFIDSMQVAISDTFPAEMWDRLMPGILERLKSNSFIPGPDRDKISELDFGKSANKEAMKRQQELFEINQKAEDHFLKHM